jgi:ABC-2 type transport system ATP-binding protein
MNAAISVKRLTKRFDRPSSWRPWRLKQGVTAVNEVSLEVEHGELFGLLGPNGAGKTTLVKMLCTLILPSSGEATVASYNLKRSVEIRRSVGLVVSDERSFYWRLSGRRNLDFFASMHGLSGNEANERINQVLEDVGMVGRGHEPFSSYSTGMKQRLAIARGLLHQPSILFLDEPSLSLDPEATSRLHSLIRQLIDAKAVTVFLITHDLSEAEKLCGRVAIMHMGSIRAIGRPADLRKGLKPLHQYHLTVGRLEIQVEEALTLAIEGLKFERQATVTLLSFAASESDNRLTTALDILRQHDVVIFKIEGQPPTMEEVFAHYITEPTKDASWAN